MQAPGARARRRPRRPGSSEPKVTFEQGRLPTGATSVGKAPASSANPGANVDVNPGQCCVIAWTPASMIAATVADDRRFDDRRDGRFDDRFDDCRDTV